VLLAGDAGVAPQVAQVHAGAHRRARDAEVVQVRHGAERGVGPAEGALQRRGVRHVDGRGLGERPAEELVDAGRGARGRLRAGVGQDDAGRVAPAAEIIRGGAPLPAGAEDGVREGQRR
jgi:hypothetical protein